MRKPATKWESITEEKKRRVLHYFKTHNENTVNAIAKKFRLSYAIVNKIINEHYDNN